MDISGAFILFFTVNVAPVCLYVLPYKYHMCVHFQRELEFLTDPPHYIGSLIQCTLSTELEVSSSHKPSQKLLSLHFYFVIEGISYGYLVPVLPVVSFPAQNSPQPQLHQLSITYSWWCFGTALQNLDKGEVGYTAVICLGPSEIEKPTAILLTRLHSLAMYVKHFFRREWPLLPFSIDDSPKLKSSTSLLDVSDFIVDLYHRYKTVSLRKGSSEPHSVCVWPQISASAFASGCKCFIRALYCTRK